MATPLRSNTNPVREYSPQSQFVDAKTHYEHCKKNAFSLIDENKLDEAKRTFAVEMEKHPDTRDLCLFAMFGLQECKTPQEVKKFIADFAF